MGRKKMEKEKKNEFKKKGRQIKGGVNKPIKDQLIHPKYEYSWARIFIELFSKCHFWVKNL